MNKLQICTTSLMLLAFVLTNTSLSEENDAIEKQKESKKAKQAQVIFNKIKSLQGEWISTEGEHKGQVALSVSIVAAGSAVVEREFPGTSEEMITIYHLDGEDVLLNHYCMLGNQPRMKAKLGDSDNTILFEFVGVTNVASKDDAHMHEGKLTFVDKDTIKSSWVLYKDGKSEGEHNFEMVRKK